MYVVLTFGAAAAFTVGGIFMKLSEGMNRLGPTLLLYLCFAAGASLQTLALRKAELGVAYVCVLGLEAVLAFLFGVLFFREAYTAVKITGIAVVVAGIVLLHLGEQ
jgi:multidrug transporter EmrE-like cation transporter